MAQRPVLVFMWAALMFMLVIMSLVTIIPPNVHKIHLVYLAFGSIGLTILASCASLLSGEIWFRTFSSGQVGVNLEAVIPALSAVCYFVLVVIHVVVAASLAVASREDPDRAYVVSGCGILMALSMITTAWTVQGRYNEESRALEAPLEARGEVRVWSDSSLPSYRPAEHRL